MDPNIADIFQREGVTFVGKGKKIVDGKQTDEDAIIIGVVEKKPLDKLSKRQIIPKEVGGQKTDIVQTGRIRAGPPLEKRGYEEEIRITRQRPIFPGISVGHPDVSAGTFGAVVYAEVEEGDIPPVENPPIEDDPEYDDEYEGCPDEANETDCKGCDAWLESGECWYDTECPDVPNEKDCSICGSWVGGKCLLDGYEEPPASPPEENPDWSFEDWLNSLPFWERLIIRILRWLGYFDEADMELLSFPSPRKVPIKRTVTKAYILSNNHVLANENMAKIGDAIWQPGSYDGGGKNDEVAKLAEFVPVSTSKPNKVDVAIAEITVPYKPDILDIGIPKEPRYDIQAGEYLQYSGRTLGYKKAKVIAIEAITEVIYDIGLTEWEGQIIVGLCDDGSPSSEGGTSGSLWLDMDKRPAGVLYAGSEEVTCINPIKAVQEALKTKIYF